MNKAQFRREWEQVRRGTKGHGTAEWNQFLQTLPAMRCLDARNTKPVTRLSRCIRWRRWQRLLSAYREEPGNFPIGQEERAWVARSPMTLMPA